MDGVHYSDISDVSDDEDTSDWPSQEDGDESVTKTNVVEDDIDKHEDPVESIISVVSGNSKAAANEQTFSTYFNDMNNITPCFNDMVNGETRMISSKQSLIRLPTERNLEQMITLKEMQEFVETFRKSRVLSGITQKEVALCLRQKYGIKISNLWISRFEGFNEFFNSMCELKPLLERLLKNFHRESVTSR